MKYEPQGNRRTMQIIIIILILNYDNFLFSAESMYVLIIPTSNKQ